MSTPYSEVPQIPVREFPANDRPKISRVSDDLYILESYCERLEAAVLLYEFCKSKKPPFPDITTTWTYIAGRDGALSIYHFGVMMEGIAGNAVRINSLAKKLDKHRIKAARKSFRQAFPRPEALRHAVSHEAQEHIQRPTQRGWIFVDSFINRQYTSVLTGKKGKSIHVSYEVSQQSVIALKNVKSIFYSAFPTRQLSY